MRAVSEAEWTLRDRKLLIAVWLTTWGAVALSLGMLIATPFHTKPYGNTLGAAAFAALSVPLFARGRRIRVDVADAGITVVGYFSQRSIAWSELLDVRVGYGGMWLTLQNGAKVRVPGMGDGLLAAVRGWHTRLDEDVDRLRREINERRSGGGA